MECLKTEVTEPVKIGYVLKIFFSISNLFKTVKLVTRAQFHQRSTYSFYARRSRMRKKRQSSQQCHLALLGPTSVKATRKTLVILTQGVYLFHQANGA